MSITDQTNDLNGQGLYRIITSIDVPDFVKSASSDDVYGTDEPLPAHVYADPVRRKFPCHTPAATWVSTAFFLDNRTEMPAKLASWVDDRLKAASAKFHIQTATEQLRAIGHVKEAAPKDDDYAIIVKYKDGSKEYHYPLTNSVEVKEAAEYLYKYRDEIPYNERRVMAERILEKANAFGADLAGIDEFVEKQAGMGACASSDVAALIENRIKALGRTDKMNEVQLELTKMASVCRTRPEQVREQSALCGLAGVIDSIDHTHGLHKQYGPMLPRPEDVLFAVTKKAASKLFAEHFSLTNGSVYKVADLAGVDLDDVRGLMGEDFADAVSAGGIYVAPEKLAEMARTLPRPDAELIDRLFRDVGLCPMFKEAVAAGFSHEEWKQIAQLEKQK